MDSRRFDQVARALAQGTTRRTAIGGLTAAIAGLLRLRAAQGACLDPALPCGVGDSCCLDHTCIAGTCTCASGQFNADGRCFVNDETCLQPGAECQVSERCCSGYSCFEGICDCPRGLYDDSGNCLSPVGPCMGDGVECGPDAACCAGFECSDGRCTQVTTLICRGIGERCDIDGDCCAESNAICRAGACACPSNHIREADRGVCSGQCAFPGEECNDVTPCCSEAGQCVAGVCQCGDDDWACGAVCVDREIRFQRDQSNCGARGVACAEGEICCAGECHPRELLNTSPDHCGSCCTACHANEVCCNGACQSPFVDSDGQDVCCADDRICPAPDGAAACCAEGDTCLDGVCCPAIATCGATCCEPGSFCYCGTCVTDLVTCASDADCCAGSCLAGYCCPATAICLDAYGVGVCCGGLSTCDTGTNICLATDARPPRPTRPGR